ALTFAQLTFRVAHPVLQLALLREFRFGFACLLLTVLVEVHHVAHVPNPTTLRGTWASARRSLKRRWWRPASARRTARPRNPKCPARVPCSRRATTWRETHESRRRSNARGAPRPGDAGPPPGAGSRGGWGR